MKSKAPLVVAAVIGVILIVLLRSVFGGDSNPAANPDSPNDPGNPTPRDGCTLITVVASSEKAALLRQIAAGYSKEAEVDGKCVDVIVNTMASGKAEQALARGWNEQTDGPKPTVWTPAASTWVGLLEGDLAENDQGNLVPEEVNSIANTPLVIAMPEPMAKELGWPNKELGWEDITRIATNPQGWASVGHPEWGSFKLGKTNPNLSTSGLAATVGALVAATGKSSDLTEADLKDPKVRAFAKAVEQSVVHYGDTTLTYLSNLQRADEAGAGLGYVSAVAIEEKSVLDYNAGNPTGDPATLGDKGKPRIPLVAIYPKEGTLYSDNPWVVLQAPWVNEEQTAAARDFEKYLIGDAAQKLFTDAGFRSFDGKAGEPLKDSSAVNAEDVKVVLSPPNPTVLSKVRDTWAELRKSARVLLVLDVSGSMGEQVGSAGGKSKLDLAKQAALDSLNEFSPEDEVGLWAFTTEMAGGANYVELVAPAPVKNNKAELSRALQSLTPLQGTPLYAATRAAYEEMSEEIDPDKINAIILLTDGRNEYPGDTDLDGLLTQLGSGSSEAKLRVFSIAYGEGADLSTLQKISEASGAKAYDATSATSIDDIFTAVVSNF